MLSDPITITINGSAKTLNRTGNDASSATYSTADGLFKARTSHQDARGGLVRTMFRLDETKVAADPIGGENASKQGSVYVVIERPSFGFSVTDLDNDWQGLKAFLTTAVITELLGGEV